MKVVINEVIGGFGLSDAAFERLIELGMSVGKNENNTRFDIYIHEDESQWEHWGKYWQVWRRQDKMRADPRLIQTIEELGDKANGIHAKLKIVEIPDNIEWYIQEDEMGTEYINEEHRSWF